MMFGEIISKITNRKWYKNSLCKNCKFAIKKVLKSSFNILYNGLLVLEPWSLVNENVLILILNWERVCSFDIYDFY